MLDIHSSKTGSRDWGWDYDKREDLGGWDFSLFLGWFHIIISRTGGNITT